jgi:hypothetical protein
MANENKQKLLTAPVVDDDDWFETCHGGCTNDEKLRNNSV